MAINGVRNYFTLNNCLLICLIIFQYPYKICKSNERFTLYLKQFPKIRHNHLFTLINSALEFSINCFSFFEVFADNIVCSWVHLYVRFGKRLRVQQQIISLIYRGKKYWRNIVNSLLDVQYFLPQYCLCNIDLTILI